MALSSHVPGSFFAARALSSSAAGRYDDGVVPPTPRFGHRSGMAARKLDEIGNKAEKIRVSAQGLLDEARQAAMIHQDQSSMDRILKDLELRRRDVEAGTSELKKTIREARRAAAAAAAPTDVDPYMQRMQWEASVGRGRFSYSGEGFAVDAPDGMADGRIREEVRQILQITDDMAATEDAAAVEERHREEEAFREQASGTFAVDSPDGVADLSKEEERKEVERIIEDEASYLKRMQYEASIGRGRFSGGGVDHQPWRA